MIGLDLVKTYLKVEHHEEDALLEHLMATSRQLCEDILRGGDSEVLQTAILYGVAYLYEHREEANHKELKATLYHLLLADRREVF